MSLTLTALENLISFNTVSARSNLEIIAYIEAFLKSRGFRLHRLPSADGTKCGLYAEIGPEGAGLLLSGHTDVVPTEGQNWTKDPFRLTRDQGRLYGRGTTDMKAYLAAMLHAADLASRRRLKEPLKLVFSYDEEIGCVGIQQMLPRLAPLIGQPRACFVGEPTEMAVAIGHKGKAALKATCHGEAGHSSLAPRFVNALHLAADFAAALRALQEELASTGARDAAYDIPYSTVHIGLMSGGTALNIVPDRAELTFEYRHLPQDSAADLLARIKAAAKVTAAPHQARFSGAHIDVEQYNAYPGLDGTEEAEVTRAALALAQTNTALKVAFGTEAGFFAGLGVPTVVCGPGNMEGQGHKPDEYITEAQLAAAEAMLARAVETLC